MYITKSKYTYTTYNAPTKSTRPLSLYVFLGEKMITGSLPEMWSNLAQALESAPVEDEVT